MVDDGKCQQPGVALALLIDRSGSMSGQPLEKARAAAVRAAADLHGSDLLEVIAFDTTAARVVGMTRVDKLRLLLPAALQKIQPGGGSAFFTALDMAYQDLSVTIPCQKHVVLISDGSSPADGLKELAAAMVAESITISTVGIDGADRLALQRLADAGGGRFYSLPVPDTLPEVIGKEVAILEKNAAAAAGD